MLPNEKTTCSPLEISEEMSREWVPGKTSMLNCKVQVAAELRLLYTELRLSLDILEKILDSVHVLQLSVEDTR